MTTDDFIDAAHAEAKRVWPGGATRAHDMAMKEARGGFVAGELFVTDDGGEA